MKSPEYMLIFKSGSGLTFKKIEHTMKKVRRVLPPKAAVDWYVMRNKELGKLRKCEFCGIDRAERTLRQKVAYFKGKKLVPKMKTFSLCGYCYKKLSKGGGKVLKSRDTSIGRIELRCI